MSLGSTLLMAQMAELRNNRDDADVTLNCQGVVIKAHSFLLGIRYDTFSNDLRGGFKTPVTETPLLFPQGLHGKDFPKKLAKI